MTELIGTKPAHATTSAYVSALKVKVPPHIKGLLIHLAEDNVNAVKFKILGSSDDSRYEMLKGDTIIAKNGSTYETLTDAWLWVDIQVKDSVAETHGSVTVNVTGA